MATLTVPNRVEFVRPVTSFLVQVARAFHVPAASQPVFEVAVSEAVTNAVRHGGDRSPESTITCQLELEQDEMVLRIIDDGEGFEMRRASMPEVSRERIDSLPASGYGLPIIQTVFPMMRAINVNGRFGVELALKCTT